jgi:hypothetical protein
MSVGALAQFLIKCRLKLGQSRVVRCRQALSARIALQPGEVRIPLAPHGSQRARLVIGHHDRVTFKAANIFKAEPY